MPAPWHRGSASNDHREGHGGKRGGAIRHRSPPALSSPLISAIPNQVKAAHAMVGRGNSGPNGNVSVPLSCVAFLRLIRSKYLTPGEKTSTLVQPVSQCGPSALSLSFLLSAKSPLLPPPPLSSNLAHRWQKHRRALCRFSFCFAHRYPPFSSPAPGLIVTDRPSVVLIPDHLLPTTSWSSLRHLRRLSSLCVLVLPSVCMKLFQE